MGSSTLPCLVLPSGTARNLSYLQPVLSILCAISSVAFKYRLKSVFLIICLSIQGFLQGHIWIPFFFFFISSIYKSVGLCIKLAFRDSLKSPIYCLCLFINIWCCLQGPSGFPIICRFINVRGCFQGQSEIAAFSCIYLSVNSYSCQLFPSGTLCNHTCSYDLPQVLNKCLGTKSGLRTACKKKKREVFCFQMYFLEL